ncbi:MAG: peptidoglycan DD-metalloendopeptidase family protein [Bacteroidota bacterium]
MKKILLVLTLLIQFINTASAQTVIDTVDSPEGKILLFSDHKWIYLRDQGFNGVLNEKVYNWLSNKETYNFSHPWSNTTCYPSGGNNDMTKLKDTLWMCVQEDSLDNFYAPVPGAVTSHYGPRSGRYHNGIDLDLETGDTVRAVWGGKIRYAQYNNGGFGNLVIIRHHNGLETFYAHLSKLLLQPNAEVAAGDPIGLGGNTGRSYGSHLHFEVRLYDAPINPEEIIDFSEFEVKNENLLVHKALFRPGAKPSDIMDAHTETETIAVAAAVHPTKVYYKVRSGDTLTQIAVRNRTTVSKLCQLNGIKPSTTIQIGRSLRIR